jgi:hypothetical protein
MVDFGDHTDMVAQSDFKDVFKHEESEEVYDVSHLWPRMDSLSDSETDRRSIPRDVKAVIESENAFDCRLTGSNVSSKRSLLIHTNRGNSYHFDDCDQLLLNASLYVASTTHSEHQSIQADFDELQ